MLADPRLAEAPDLGTQPALTRAEVDAELRARMGLGGRVPTRYEATLPPVAGLARELGLRP